MKFKKEITLVIEGEIFDEKLSPLDVFKSAKLFWKHWWECDPKWTYGAPSDMIKGGQIHKISLIEEDSPPTSQDFYAITYKKFTTRI
jgi:hypothetical protein